MAITIRTDNLVELTPDEGKVIKNKFTGTLHTIVVCLAENIERYEEIENQNDENSKTEEPIEE